MTDDTDDMQIMDLASARAMAEPRSAVEAASNPAHGGGVPAFTEVEIPGQGIAKMALNPVTQGVQMQGVGVAQGITGAVGTPGLIGPVGDIDTSGAPRTISSGIARFAEAYDGAVAMVNEFGDLVGEIEGDAIEAVSTAGIMVTAGTAGAIHDLAGGYDALFARIADLVKRAKAVHG